ncbi:MAG: Uma2 family endonuclease [Isosphaeraceae bacterium]
MATATILKRYTPEEYLELERRAAFRSEYRRGYITAMAGTSPEHNTIALNFASEVRVRLRARPCRVYMSDVRLLVSPTGLSTYPDIMAVCGGAEFAPGDLETLTNPSMIAEVLSRTTEAYDRGEKFQDYKTIPSLKKFLLIARDRVLVERFERKGQEWVRTEYRDIGETVVLQSLGCAIPLSEIHAGPPFTGAL